MAYIQIQGDINQLVMADVMGLLKVFVIIVNWVCSSPLVMAYNCTESGCFRWALL